MKDLKFAEKMKERRGKLGITQKELAKMTHLAPATISAYENGAKTPTLDSAIAIADVLDISLDALRVGSKEDFSTYSDIFNVMLFLIDEMGACVVEYEESSYKKCSSLYFANNLTITKMLEKIRDIKKVLGSTEAEKELYNLWKESKTKEYSQHELFDNDTFPGSAIINDPERHNPF